MYAGYLEDGDKCPEKGCEGKMYFPLVVNCSCHISPPCGACTSNQLTCDECNFVQQEPECKDVPVAPGLSMRVYQPKPLDKTKISYRTYMHSSCSQLVKGVFPEGTTRGEVEERVKGTFGGRFTHFGNGRFEYVAYTD